jgi:hypothetical protein
MDAKDRRVLLEIAEAWTMRAQEAERRKSTGDGKASHIGDDSPVRE